MTDNRTALAQRFASLPHAKQISFIQALTAKGGDFTSLPIIPAPSGADYPLSYGQQSLWLTWQLEPDSPAYNMAGVLMIEGPLDSEVLAQSIQALMERHSALRTRFHTDDQGTSFQRIVPLTEVSGLTTVDISDRAGGQREAECQRLVDELANAPFDLTIDDALRSQLIRLDDNHHQLVLSMHHINSDGWSIPLLLRDIIELYQALGAQRAPQLPALPIRLADFARWQRTWLDAGEKQRQLDYWQGVLGTEHPVLALPTLKPRAAVTDDRLASHAFTLDTALSARARAFAREHQASLFIVLQAVFALTLGRYSGARDVRIGMPVVNRRRAETHDLVGYLTNLQVLPTDLTPGQSFVELLTQVRDRVLNGQLHQDLPFDLLVEALQPERQAGIHPLFQVKMTEQEQVAERFEFAGLTMELSAREAQRAHFDLSFDFTDCGDLIRGELAWMAELYDGELMQQISAALVRYLQQLLDAPTQPIGTLLQEPQAGVINGERCAFAHATLLPLWAEAWADNRDQLALVDGERQLSYAELDHCVTALAMQLQQQGVGTETVVALYAGRSLEAVIGMLATLRAGGVYLPLDPKLPAERLQWQLADSAAELMLSAATTAAPVWAEGVAQRAIDIAVLRQSTPSLDGFRTPVIAASQAAYIIYTSGSTGRPKGVVVPHGSLNNYVQALLARLALPASVRSMAMVSTVAADLGHTVLFGALSSGRTLHLLNDDQVMDPDAFGDYMNAHQVDVLKLVPSHLRALMQAEQAMQVLPRHTLVLGGEALTGALLAAVQAVQPDCRVINHYGPTEATVGALTRQADPQATTVAIGQPLANLNARILDASLNPVPAGVAGELYLGGAGVVRGYLGRAGLSAEYFLPDPEADYPGARIYRTGDKARMQADGSIEFLGRIDDQVKIRGYRVELAEIAARLMALDGVQQAEVITQPGDDERLQLCGYLVAEAGVQLDTAALRSSLAQQLPDYMVPDALRVLEAIPLTANGKVDRKALPLPDQASDTSAYTAPQGEVEEALAAIWAEVLKQERVSRDANFFELGGDSILSLQIVARSRKAGLKFMPKQLFDSPTLAALAAQIDDSAAAAQPAAIARLSRAQRQQPLALSNAQLRMWFLHQLTPDSSAYHVGGTLKLTGQVDYPALVDSFQALVARHESLRTVFISRDAQQMSDDPQAQPAYQQVHDSLMLEVPLIDVRQADTSVQAARDQAQQIAALPFDPENGPLLRVALLRWADDGYLLTVVMHHIISDGWSVQLIIDEFSRLYQARLASQSLALPTLPLQYADYANWQRNWLQEGEGAKQLDYWTGLLGREPAPLMLPVDHPRTAAADYRASSHLFELPPALVDKTHQLARRKGMTPFMILLAAFQVLLYRYSGQPKIRVGVPIANRHRPDTQGIVGFFVNTQVLPAELSGRMRVEQLLTQVKGIARGAQDNQDLPFDTLVDALQPERTLNQTPLFQVMFNHQRDEGKALLQLPGIEPGEIESLEGGAQFELILETRELAGGELSASLTYAAELFDPATIARMAGHYQSLLTAMVTHGATALADLPLLSAAEQQQLQARGENTRRYPLTVPMHRLLEQRVAQHPEKPALRFATQQLSYDELNRRANRLAHHLIACGVAPDVPVGIALERSVEMVVGLLAVLKAGGAYVPLDPEYPTERLAYMIDHSGIELILSQSSLRSELPLSAAQQLLALDCLDLSDQPEHNPTVALHRDNLAYVIYTSGSTGKPKGVMVAHGGLTNFLLSMQQAPGLTAEDTLLAVTSLSFDIAALELYLPLISGGQLLLASQAERQHGQQLAALIDQHSVSVMQATPASWRMLLDFAALEGQAWQFPSAFRAFCGGEALPSDLADGLLAHGIRLWNLYGPTETTIWSALDPVQNSQIALGQPVAATGLYVVDSQLNPVPQGVPGELLIGGEGLTRGYFQRADLTAERFIANPFSDCGERLYRTGDQVRWTAAGTLEYLQRLDNQVKIRGFRIELGEIENQLNHLAPVRQGVVVARDGGQGSLLAAYVECREGQTLSLAELRQQLMQQLPDYMLPTRLQLMDALPLTPNGKVDRNALPGLDRSEAAVYAAPEGEVEQALAAIWQDVLKVERVSRHDSFFDLGGHSLLAVNLITRLNLELQLSVSVRSLFEQPVLVNFSDHVSSLSGSGMTSDKLDNLDAFMNELETM